MGLQVRLYLLLGLMFVVLYIIITGVAGWMGIGNLLSYGIIAIVLVFIQYLIGPSMVARIMRVEYVSEQERPELHQMISELAQPAGIPKPKVGVSPVTMPNAFAFGRSKGDARVCVTEGLLDLLSKDELRAVLGHEISHVKHRDMTLITLLSVFPLIIYFISWGLMWSGGRRREGGGNPLPLIGLGMLLLYFVVHLLVLYGSRIREYYADLGSVELGNQPRHLATALYKLAYGNARVSKESLKRMEGAKAFFVNDPSRAMNEVRELSQVDADMSGTIDYGELEALRSKSVYVGTGDRLMELMSTHPNMLKRIKHLSSLM